MSLPSSVSIAQRTELLENLIDKIGDYEIGEKPDSRKPGKDGRPGKEGDGDPRRVHERVNKILQRPAARRELYEPYDEFRVSPTKARKEFIEALVKKKEGFLLTPKVSAVQRPISLEEFFKDKHLLELYKKAVAEEYDSKEFREAVFLQATSAYEAPPINAGEASKKSKTPFIAWVTGPSSAGKSHYTPDVIKKITGGKRITKHGELIKTTEGVDLVTSVDGSIEREVCQMRQLVLQAALKEGYTGIKDLNSQTEEKNVFMPKLRGKKGINKIKSKIKKAALAQGLNLAIPVTLTNPPGAVFFLMREMRKYQEKSPYRDKEDPSIVVPVNLVYSEVVGADPETFQETVKGMGDKRAWWGNPENHNIYQDPFKMNNRAIGCESKKYGSKYFMLGRNQGMLGRKKFREAFPKSTYLAIENDTLFVKLDLAHNNILVECSPYDPKAILMSAREYLYWNSDAFRDIRNATDPVSFFVKPDPLHDNILVKCKAEDDGAILMSESEYRNWYSDSFRDIRNATDVEIPLEKKLEKNKEIIILKKRKLLPEKTKQSIIKSSDDDPSLGLTSTENLEENEILKKRRKQESAALILLSLRPYLLQVFLCKEAQYQNNMKVFKASPNFRRLPVNVRDSIEELAEALNINQADLIETIGVWSRLELSKKPITFLKQSLRFHKLPPELIDMIESAKL